VVADVHNPTYRRIKTNYIICSGVGMAGGAKDAEMSDVLISRKAYGYESGKNVFPF
jgi:hypothetical protein